MNPIALSIHRGVIAVRAKDARDASLELQRLALDVLTHTNGTAVHDLRTAAQQLFHVSELLDRATATIGRVVDAYETGRAGRPLNH